MMHKQLLDAALDALWDAVQSGDKARIEQARATFQRLLEPLLQ